MGDKCAEVLRDDLWLGFEFDADPPCNLLFRETLFEKFKHPRADEVQPEHLSVKDVENDGAVLVMG